MLLTGLAFIVLAALVQLAGWSVSVAALVVGLGLIILAIAVGERWPVTRP